jgi:hypothetical protein
MTSQPGKLARVDTGTQPGARADRHWHSQQPGAGILGTSEITTAAVQKLVLTR